jgi:uncharacterized hydrophobic protein (TIGR00271 family)
VSTPRGEGGPEGPAAGRERRLRGAWWVPKRRELTEEQRRDVLSQLFFEGADRRPFLARFSILLALSVSIAVFGLAADSAPVVIGAMLVSPLTTPLMGLAASLVLGWPRRQLESILILAVATAGGIGLAWLAVWAVPEPASLTEKSGELLARTSPQLLDLGVAVLAGAAGAYVLIRREAVAALPGVAIAVALVPPLSTVGITLEIGRPDLADDALLLYLTNLAGVVLSASLVLLLNGVTPRPVAGRLPARTRVGIAGAALAVLVVAYPLTAVTRRTVKESIDRDDAVRIAERWAEGEEQTFLQLRRRSDDFVVVDVAGDRRPSPPGDLADQLSREFEEPVRVRVHWLKRTTLSAIGTP